MVHSIEELSLNAWPALQTVLYDGWVIRFSNGYTKRANSVTPLYNSALDLDTKIYFCESLFENRELKPVFKITEDAHPKNLDKTLEERGYKLIDHVSLQVLSLLNVDTPSIHTVEIMENLNSEWLDQFCLLTHQNGANRATMKQMFSLIIPKTCYISLYEGDAVVACGLGVLERGYLGIFDIVTAETYRKRGFGVQLMLNLLNWGKENGAQTAYLQVLKNNIPALKLYSKLGFKENYQYWYRIKE